MIFAVFHQAALEVVGNEFSQSFDDFVRVATRACQWPLCIIQHAIIHLYFPCLSEYLDVCGSQNGQVFVMQSAFLVELDTLCKIDIMLMKTKGKHDCYA